MSLDMLPRSAWNARPRRHHPGILEADEVRGLAFHWPGTQSSRPLSRAAVPRALRSWQDFHMDGHGWSDIAYQVAVDQWGRVWELRGLENRSAANGGTTVNATHGAVLLVLVQNEEPSAAMLESVRAVVAEFRRLFRHGRELVGHGDLRKSAGLAWTDCPGPAVRRRLRLEHFEPTGEDDQMPNVDELWNHPIPEFDKHTKRDTTPARVVLSQAHNRAGDARRAAVDALRQANRNADAIEQLAHGLDQLAGGKGIAARVVEALGERIELTLELEEGETA